MTTHRNKLDRGALDEITDRILRYAENLKSKKNE